MPDTALEVDPKTESLATEDVLIFVSPTGNDANPGTAAEPLRTFEEAVRRLRPHWRKKQRISLAPGTYTLPASPQGFQVHLGHQLGAEAEPLLIEGAFTDQFQLGVRKITAKTASSVTSAGLTLQPDSLVGSRLRLTSGGVINHAYIVAANTADTITVSGSFSKAPVVGDTFVIEQPAVTLEYPTGMVFTGGGASQLVLVGLKFRATTPNAGFFQIGGGMPVYAEGCEWDMNGGLFQVVEQSFLTSGGVGGLIPLQNKSTNLPSSGCYAHDGFSGFNQVDAAAGFRASNGGVIFGSWVTRNTGLNAQSGGMVLTLSAKTCGLTVNGFYGSAYIELIGPSRIENAPADAVKVSHGGHVRLKKVGISNAVGIAVDVDEDSLALLSGVTGTGNGQQGVRADHGARVRADAATTVTGKQGDILVGSAKHFWAEVHVGAGISDPATFTRIEKL